MQPDWLTKSGHPPLDKIAQRALVLLYGKIKNQMGIKILIGAELEFASVADEKGERDNTDLLFIPYQQEWKDRPYYAGMSTKAEKYGINWLDNSRYVSGICFEQDQGEILELVFGHEAPDSNPVRLAGAIENAKKNLRQEFVKNRNVEFSPVVRKGNTESYQSLQISFTISREGKNLVGFEVDKKTRYLGRMQPVLAETALFWAPDADSLTRLEKVSENKSQYTIYNAVSRSHERTEVRFGSARANAYLVMVSLLAGIVYAEESKHLPAPQDKVLVSARRTPEELLQNLKNSQNFRAVLNDLSPERLGDMLIAAINSPEQAVSEGKPQGRGRA